MAPANDYPTVYGLWTRKGGVGKTTLSFNLATLMAKLFPDKAVVCVDCCPQANLSACLLTKVPGSQGLDRDAGDVKVRKLSEGTIGEYEAPKTIAGYIYNCISEEHRQNIPAHDFLTPLNPENPNVPANMHLLCGDRTLDLLAPELSDSASKPVTVKSNPYTRVHKMLRVFVSEVAKHFREVHQKEAVFFIDTNPALTVYTEIALCAMTEMVVPADADDFSVQAIQSMFHLVYGLYPAKGPMADFEELSFAFKARQYGLPLPKLACIVHNKMKPGSVTDDGTAAPAAAYGAISHAQLESLADGYQAAAKVSATPAYARGGAPLLDERLEAMGLGERASRLEQVFKNPNPDSALAHGSCTSSNMEAFGKKYTAIVYDMWSAGVASMRCGVPIYKLHAVNKRPAEFSSLTNAQIRAKSSKTVKELVTVLGKLLGPQLDQADAEAKAELEALMGAPITAPAVITTV